MGSSNAKEPLREKMMFRIAVTEVESWLLADHVNLGAFIGAPVDAFPRDTEIDDPKEHLLRCVERYGNRKTRAEMLPNGNAKVGLGYNAHLIQFVENLWNFNEASQRNGSLRRAIARIAEAQRFCG